MNSLLLSILLALAVAACSGASLSSHNSISNVVVFPTKTSKSVRSPRAIEGVLDCGSESVIVDVRFDECDKIPCEAQIGRSYRVEADFRPSKLRNILLNA